MKNIFNYFLFCFAFYSICSYGITNNILLDIRDLDPAKIRNDSVASINAKTGGRIQEYIWILHARQKHKEASRLIDKLATHIFEHIHSEDNTHHELMGKTNPKLMTLAASNLKLVYKATGSINEVLTYEVDQTFSLYVVPLTLSLLYNNQQTSFQVFVPNSPGEGNPSDDRLRTLDFIVKNIDRGANRLYTDLDHMEFASDNGDTFDVRWSPVIHSAIDVQTVQPSKETLQKLKKAMDSNAIKRLLPFFLELNQYKKSLYENWQPTICRDALLAAQLAKRPSQLFNARQSAIVNSEPSEYEYNQMIKRVGNILDYYH